LEGNLRGHRSTLSYYTAGGPKPFPPLRGKGLSSSIISGKEVPSICVVLPQDMALCKGKVEFYLLVALLIDPELTVRILEIPGPKVRPLTSTIITS
jgi:hypothetical protein